MAAQPGIPPSGAQYEAAGAAYQRRSTPRPGGILACRPGLANLDPVLDLILIGPGRSSQVGSALVDITLGRALGTSQWRRVPHRTGHIRQKFQACISALQVGIACHRNVKILSYSQRVPPCGVKVAQQQVMRIAGEHSSYRALVSPASRGRERTRINSGFGGAVDSPPDKITAEDRAYRANALHRNCHFLKADATLKPLWRSQPMGLLYFCAVWRSF
jgi:hypothetical protein